MLVLKTHMLQKYPVIESLDLMEALVATLGEVELGKSSNYLDLKRYRFSPISGLFYIKKVSIINVF